MLPWKTTQRPAVLILPSSHADEGILPPRPPTVCQTCWEGPIAWYSRVSYPVANPESVRFDWNVGRKLSTSIWSTSVLKARRGNPAGCVWCSLFQNVLHDILKLPQENEGPEQYELRTTSKDKKCPYEGAAVKFKLTVLPSRSRELGYLLNVMLLGKPHEHYPAGTVSFYFHTAADDPAARYIIPRSPLRDVGSSRALSLARSLISDCVCGHDKCAQISPSSNKYLPTRLIECTDPNTPRLASTVNGRYGRYITLSYVWGEAQPHQTTKANVAAYSSGIDVRLLPQTIRDAIYVTRTLGFQYLWVDSLCIIQDSDEDKAHELGRMHLVYRHSCITIIAASAERASDGFLQERPATPPVATLPFICPRPRPGEEQLIGTVHLNHSRTFVPRTDPIDQRGWCLQEQLLAPRVLIFNSETLEFNCHTAFRLVGGAPNPRNDLLSSPGSTQRLPSELLLPETPPDEFDATRADKMSRVWWRVVESYTERTISNPSDKLVACGAIAEAFGRVLGPPSEYLAGLWRFALLAGLMWMEDRCAWPGDLASTRRLSRSPVYLAPTWSWASVTGPVYYKNFDPLSDETLAEVVECNIVLKDPKLPFGQVVGGHLVIRAPVLALPLSTRTSASSVEWELRIDDPRDEEIVEQGGAEAVALLVHAASYHGLVVARADSADSDGPTSSPGRRVYRRLGVFWTWDDEVLHGPEIPRTELVLV